MADKGIIRRILVTEKGEKLAVQDQFLLEVAKDATKPQIRQAVEKQYGVHVLAVRTMNVKGATRTIRGTRLTRTEPTRKHAIVQVKKGERIENV